jgi:hypothetical protein
MNSTRRQFFKRTGNRALGGACLQLVSMANPATADAGRPKGRSADPASAKPANLRSHVREQNGAVRLFLNDQPVTLE